MIARLQLRALLAALGVLVALVLLVDFLDSARHLFGKQATFLDVLLLYLYKLPSVVHLMLPVALVVGTCVSFALLGRHLELRALAAAGVGPGRLARPVLSVASGCAVAVMLLAELGVPPAFDRFEKLMLERFGRIDSSWRFFRSHMWVQGDGNRLIRARRKADDGRKLQDVTVLEVDDDFHLVERVDARVVYRRGDRWIGTRVEVRRFEDGRLVSFHRARQQEMAWTEGPERFRDLSGRPQQKTLSALSETIREMERRGLNAAEYRLQMHNRFAYPLLGMALVLLVFPWLARPACRRTLAGALVESMGLIFVAYFLVALSFSAVSNGLLAPWLGAWLPLFLLLVAAAPRWLILVRHSRMGASP